MQYCFKYMDKTFIIFNIYQSYRLRTRYIIQTLARYIKRTGYRIVRFDKCISRHSAAVGT